MVLVGDVGGAKTILVLLELSDNAWVCEKQLLYASSNIIHLPAC